MAEIINAKIIERLAADVTPELIPELAKLFLQDIRTKTEQMELCVKKQDAAAIEDVAHAMSGVAASFGAEEMEASCRKIMHLCREKNLSEAIKYTEILPLLAHRIEKAISPYL